MHTSTLTAPRQIQNRWTSLLITSVTVVLTAVWLLAGAPQAVTDQAVTDRAATSMGSSAAVLANDAPVQDSLVRERVVLRAGPTTVSVALDDNPASRELAVMLPLRLQLRDAMGQTKVVRLPRPLTIGGLSRTVLPVEGGVYYWPPTGELAVYYDDLGQQVPPPGLVRLGTVVHGLGSLAGFRVVELT